MEPDYAQIDADIATALAASGIPRARRFSYAHLPPHLRGTSRDYARLAVKACKLPPGDDRDDALRFLLCAKDAAVRSLVP